MTKKDKKKKERLQILSFPLPIREGKSEIMTTLHLAKEYANEYLKAGYKAEILTDLEKSGTKAYKILEPVFAFGVKT